MSCGLFKLNVITTITFSRPSTFAADVECRMKELKLVIQPINRIHLKVEGKTFNSSPMGRTKQPIFMGK